MTEHFWTTRMFMVPKCLEIFSVCKKYHSIMFSIIFDDSLTVNLQSGSTVYVHRPRSTLVKYFCTHKVKCLVVESLVVKSPLQKTFAQRHWHSPTHRCVFNSNMSGGSVCSQMPEHRGTWANTHFPVKLFGTLRALI